VERRTALKHLLRKTSNSIVLSEHMNGPDGEVMFRHACAMGLEGIVCKRVDRPYSAPQRHGWASALAGPSMAASPTEPARGT
jgi:bifunctional non-homologous end joining protein LigD